MKRLQLLKPPLQRIDHKPFSKYDFVEKLTKNGLKKVQAAIIADAIKNQEETYFNDLVTKHELFSTKQELKDSIEEIKTELKRDLKETELRIVIKLGVMTTTIMAAFSILPKIFL